MKPKLTYEDYSKCAEKLGIETAVIMAVAEVESSGAGFGLDDRPKILFEGHWFSKFTKGVFDESYPTISYPKWTREFYGRNQYQEWKRYDLAWGLDTNAASMATSWGKFQIMGFNFRACLYARLSDFLSDMYESEAKQLKAFANFLTTRGLIDELQGHQWTAFARHYNGPGYRANRYDEKLYEAYEKFKAL